MSELFNRLDHVSVKIQRVAALSAALLELAENWGVLHFPDDRASALLALIDILNKEIGEAREAHAATFEALPKPG